MSLLAAGFVVVLYSPAEIDRNALRAQARMPNVQVNWSFSQARSSAVLKQQKLDRLQAIKKPTGDQLFRIAWLKDQIADDKVAKPFYLRAISRLEKEGRRTVAAQSDLALALVKVGRRAEAIKIAEGMTTSSPNNWLSWSTLGAVRAENYDTDKVSNVNFSDPALVVQRIKNEPNFRSQLQKVKNAAAEARSALDKGVELAPLEPEAYRFRANARTSGIVVEALTALLDTKEESPDQTAFLNIFAAPVNDLRRVALLTNDPEDVLGYAMVGLMVAGMKYGTEHQDEPFEGKIPQVVEGAEKAEFQTMLDRALARTSRLAPTKRAAVYKDAAFCFVFLGDAKRAAALAGKAALGLPQDQDAARQHLDAMFLSGQFADGAKAGAAYASSHPKWREVTYRAAKMMEHENRLAPALEIIDAELKQNPKDARAILARASLRLRLPDYAKHLPAIADEVKLVEALKLDDNNLRTEATILRAICLGLSGKTSEAKELLDGIDSSDDTKLADRVAAAAKALG